MPTVSVPIFAMSAGTSLASASSFLTAGAALEDEDDPPEPESFESSSESEPQPESRSAAAPKAATAEVVVRMEDPSADGTSRSSQLWVKSATRFGAVEERRAFVFPIVTFLGWTPPQPALDAGSGRVCDPVKAFAVARIQE